MDGKQILDEKDGVVKMSYTTYHTRVMKILADKDMFHSTYKPYKKQYLRGIYNTISCERGEEFVNRSVEFFQASYSAYEAIFVAGKRSIFGPADVKGDFEQHLAQTVHFFKHKISEEALL